MRSPSKCVQKTKDSPGTAILANQGFVLNVDPSVTKLELEAYPMGN